MPIISFANMNVVVWGLFYAVLIAISNFLQLYVGFIYLIVYHRLRQTKHSMVYQDVLFPQISFLLDRTVIRWFWRVWLSTRHLCLAAARLFSGSYSMSNRMRWSYKATARQIKWRGNSDPAKDLLFGRTSSVVLWRHIFPEFYYH